MFSLFFTNNYIVWFQTISIPTPWKIIGNAKEDWGLESQSFQGKYEAKFEYFPEGWCGGPNQKPSMGGVWVFCGKPANCYIAGTLPTDVLCNILQTFLNWKKLLWSLLLEKQMKLTSLTFLIGNNHLP